MPFTHRAILPAAALAAGVLSSQGFAPQALAQELTAKSVVLVHGAFADGSSWNAVAPLLEEAGLDVIAVQNPLESLAGDVAFTERAIERVEGPVVLVGHSWGGMVITEAGAADKVQSLVYVAAYAPDQGQSLGQAAKLNEYPAPGIASLKEDASGYLYLTDEATAEFFAQDLPMADAQQIANSQGLLKASALEEPVSRTAWSEKPSHYVIAGEDNMTPTPLQREFAQKIGATTVEVSSSHVVMLSNPKAVADAIIEASK